MKEGRRRRKKERKKETTIKKLENNENKSLVWKKIENLEDFIFYRVFIKEFNTI